MNILNDKWFASKFNNEKYIKLVGIVNSNVEQMITYKSVDKIKPQISKEFSKIFEPQNAESFLSDLKNRLNIITDFYEKIKNLIVFTSNTKMINSFRQESFPKLSNRISRLNKTPVLCSLVDVYKFIPNDQHNEDIPKKAFCPFNTDRKLIKINPKQLSLSISKKDLKINKFVFNNLNTNSNLIQTITKMKRTSQSLNKANEQLNKTIEFNRNGNRYRKLYERTYCLNTTKPSTININNINYIKGLEIKKSKSSIEEFPQLNKNLSSERTKLFKSHSPIKGNLITEDLMHFNNSIDYKKGKYK